MAVTPPPAAPASAPSPSPPPQASAPTATPAPAQPKAPMIPTGIPHRTEGDLVRGLSRLPPAAQMPMPAPAGPPAAQPAQPAQPAPAAAQPAAPTPPTTPQPASPAPAPASAPAPGAGRGQPAPAAVGGNAEPAAPDAAPEQAGPVRNALSAAWDNMGITDFVKSQGAEASKMLGQAGDFAKSIFSSSEGQATVAEAQTGEISEPKQQVGLKNLEGEVGLEAAKNMWGQMTPWDHALLWGGAGIGILGLINVMTGEGGIGSWIMGILGLLGAAIPLARHGVFGQGAQELTQNLSDMGGNYLSQFTGQGQDQGQTQPQAPAAGMNMGSLMKAVTDAVGPENADKVMAKVISQFATDEQRNKLNRGAGVGGFGNKAMGWLGGFTGKTDRQMREQGFNPGQQERVFDVMRGLAEQQ